MRRADRSKTIILAASMVIRNRHGGYRPPTLVQNPANTQAVGTVWKGSYPGVILSDFSPEGSGAQRCNCSQCLSASRKMLRKAQHDAGMD